MLELFPRLRRDIAPGVVHLPDWLDEPWQRRLVRAVREWAAIGPGPRYPRLPGGAVMSVASLHLGWHWLPYRYSATRDDQDGSPALPLPRWLADLGARAVAEAYDEKAGAAYRPDSAGVNFYRGDARLGMHVDREELVDDPLVSFSLGTACVFRVGNTKNPGRPYTDIELHSGDLLVFGKQNRRIYHGVPRLLPKYGNPQIGTAQDERINVTVRVSGL